MAKIKSNWPLLLLGFFILIIAVINFSPTAFLTGGDNLHPEFNIVANLKRSIFAVWQEYQGVGLLGGMGHASDLLRQIVVAFISSILSTNYIRYILTFLTLYIGTAGTYYLIRKILSLYNESYINSTKLQLLSFAGAAFYLFNLATLQTYFIPFEVFTSHFAALPWLILVSINFFIQRNFKNLALLSLVLFLATPGAYVPTLFVVYLLAVFILSPFLIPGGWINKIRVFSKYILIVLIINSFWLLPFLYSTLTISSVNVNAKINQMATENIFLENKQYGGIFDVSILKGFWFSNVEPNLKGDFAYMLAPWRNYIQIPIISALGYLNFVVIFIGLVSGFIKKKKITLAFGILFVFVFTMLTVSTPPFSFIDEFLRNHIPLFSQIFRFTFTKFSILAGLVYSIFFAIGLDYLLIRLNRTSLRSYIGVTIISTLFLITFCLPMFTGHLFYEKETIKIPQEYFDTFSFFKKQDVNTRIADFPQYSFWGWDFYKWGYSGSGFLWYGIEQPIMDRAFDVWSLENENYYWEISSAIYSKNPTAFKTILNKYQVNWLVIDKNLINPTSYRSLFIGELHNMLTQIPEAKKQAQFGNIEIYKFTPSDKPNNFVYAKASLPTVNAYKISNVDQAYSDTGDYINVDNNSDLFYPFRSLLTSKTQKDIEFESNDSKDYIEFSKTLPTTNKETRLEIPSLVSNNNMLPIDLTVAKEGDYIVVNMILKSPQIILQGNNPSTFNNLNGKKIWEVSIKQELLRLPGNQKYPLNINLNGVNNFTINQAEDTGDKILAHTSVSIDQNNSITVSDAQNSEIVSKIITPDSIREVYNTDKTYITLPKIAPNTKIVVKIPKIEDQYQYQLINAYQKTKDKQAYAKNCDNFRKGNFSIVPFEENGKTWTDITGTNSTPCLSFYLQTLDHDQGYFITIDNKNIQGRGLHVWILNEDQKFAPIDTYLPGDKKEENSTLILPPYEKFGKAYSIHFDNSSIGNDTVENYLGNTKFYPIPYSFITKIRLLNNQSAEPTNTINLSVSHPNQSLYLVNLKDIKSNEENLILSQGFNPGWAAYQVRDFNVISEALPFLGTKITQHNKVNNWENGWTIEDKSGESMKIVIIYLPQYLEYLGFILSSSIIFYLIFIVIKKRR